MTKKRTDTRFFLLIFVFLFILILAKVYYIPVILQIFGLVALTFLPGYLICLLFGIRVTDPIENFLYRLGLSIIFDLLLSLVLNAFLPVFGNKTPLSSINLHIGYSVIIIFLALLIILTDRVPTLTLQPIRLLKIEKLFLMFGLLILTCVETGIHMLNMGFTNLILILSIFLIPLLLLLCIIYHDDTLKRIYPFVIYLLGTSLLIIFALRSNYVVGVDAHEEYYLFIQILTKSVWNPDPTLLLSSALSISLLPMIFDIFLSADPMLLFKLVYPFIFSFIPLIVYVIVKKYFSELLALFAAFFFMFQAQFIMVSGIARTSIGIFFIALSVLVICDKEMRNAKRYALLLLFIAGSIFSHYTSSFIFLFIIIMAYLIDLVITIREPRREARLINLPLIIFFFGLIFFWYQQMINIVFRLGLEFTLERNNIFIDMINNEVSGYLSAESGYTLPPTYLLRLINYSRLALYALMAIGIFVTFYSLVRKKIPSTSAFYNIAKINRTLTSMALVAIILLLSGIFVPFLYLKYDTGRMLQLLYVILPVFLIAGAYTLFTPKIWHEILPVTKKFFQPFQNFILVHGEKIVAGLLLILLVTQLLAATTISNQIDGGPYSILLNSPKFPKDLDPIYQNPEKFSYIFDQDAAALKWFESNSDESDRIFSDPYGNKKITSLLERPTSLYQTTFLDLPDGDLNNASIFLTLANGYYGHLLDYNGMETDISSLDQVKQKNKIFANGAVIYL